MAVAPLVLCKYFGSAAICPVLIWCAVIVAVWVFMSPSKGEDEHTPEARRRFTRGVVSDPFVWMSLVLVGYCAVVALNGGVGLAYDAEQSVWSLKSPVASSLPGGVSGTGGMFFAVSLTVLVLYPGVVHSLDSRQSVYFSVSAAAIAVLDAILADASGVGISADAAVIYGLLALMAAAVMFSAERSDRRPKEMLAAIVLSGCVAALLFTRRSVVVCVFAAALAVFALSFVVFSFRRLRLAGLFRAFLLLMVSLAFGAAIYHWRVGDWATLIPVWSHEADTTITRLAYHSWSERPWLGVGLGAFPMAAKISATSTDWAVMGPLPDFYSNGWRSILVERGMIGILAIIASVGALLFAWFRRVRSCGREHFPTALPLLPLALIAVSVSLVFDGSGTSAESLLVFAGLAAFSINGGT